MKTAIAEEETTILDFTSMQDFTRFEKENILDVSNKLSMLYNHKEDDKLRFLYLECFGKSEENINKIFTKLQKEIKFNNNSTLKIIDFFELINQK